MSTSLTDQQPTSHQSTVLLSPLSSQDIMGSRRRSSIVSSSISQLLHEQSRREEQQKKGHKRGGSMNNISSNHASILQPVLESPEPVSHDSHQKKSTTMSEHTCADSTTQNPLQPLKRWSHRKSISTKAHHRKSLSVDSVVTLNDTNQRLRHSTSGSGLRNSVRFMLSQQESQEKQSHMNDSHSRRSSESTHSLKSDESMLEDATTGLLSTPQFSKSDYPVSLKLSIPSPLNLNLELPSPVHTHWLDCYDYFLSDSSDQPGSTIVNKEDLDPILETKVKGNEATSDPENIKTITTHTTTYNTEEPPLVPIKSPSRPRHVSFLSSPHVLALSEESIQIPARRASLPTNSLQLEASSPAPSPLLLSMSTSDLRPSPRLRNRAKSISHSLSKSGSPLIQSESAHSFSMSAHPGISNTTNEVKDMDVTYFGAPSTFVTCRRFGTSNSISSIVTTRNESVASIVSGTTSPHPNTVEKPTSPADTASTVASSQVTHRVSVDSVIIEKLDKVLEEEFLDLLQSPSAPQSCRDDEEETNRRMSQSPMPVQRKRTSRIRADHNSGGLLLTSTISEEVTLMTPPHDSPKALTVSTTATNSADTPATSVRKSFGSLFETPVSVEFSPRRSSLTLVTPPPSISQRDSHASSLVSTVEVNEPLTEQSITPRSRSLSLDQPQSKSLSTLSRHSTSAVKATASNRPVQAIPFHTLSLAEIKEYLLQAAKVFHEASEGAPTTTPLLPPILEQHELKRHLEMLEREEMEREREREEEFRIANQKAEEQKHQEQSDSLEGNEQVLSVEEKRKRLPNTLPDFVLRKPTLLPFYDLSPSLAIIEPLAYGGGIDSHSNMRSSSDTQKPVVSSLATSKKASDRMKRVRSQTLGAYSLFTSQFSSSTSSVIQQPPVPPPSAGGLSAEVHAPVSSSSSTTATPLSAFGIPSFLTEILHPSNGGSSERPLGSRKKSLANPIITQGSNEAKTTTVEKEKTAEGGNAKENWFKALNFASLLSGNNSGEHSGATSVSLSTQSQDSHDYAEPTLYRSAHPARSKSVKLESSNTKGFPDEPSASSSTSPPPIPPKISRLRTQTVTNVMNLTPTISLTSPVTSPRNGAEQQRQASPRDSKEPLNASISEPASLFLLPPVSFLQGHEYQMNMNSLLSSDDFKLTDPRGSGSNTAGGSIRQSIDNTSSSSRSSTSPQRAPKSTTSSVHQPLPSGTGVYPDIPRRTESISQPPERRSSVHYSRTTFFGRFI